MEEDFKKSTKLVLNMFYYIDEDKLKIIATDKDYDWEQSLVFSSLEEAKFQFGRYLKQLKKDSEVKLRRLIQEEQSLRSSIKRQEAVLLVKDVIYTICKECNGTGEVHSHNPTCWECSGRGTIELASEAINSKR